MPRRRLHGNLRGSMCSTRFVRGIRYYNVFYTSSRRLDPRKFAERARLARIKLNFQVFVILIEVCRRRVYRSMTCSLETPPRSTRRTESRARTIERELSLASISLMDVLLDSRRSPEFHVNLPDGSLHNTRAGKLAWECPACELM